MNSEIWRAIFDAIEEPAFLHDAQFRLTLANRAYCHAAGVTEAQALGKPYWEVFPPGTGPLPGCHEAATGRGDTGSEDELSVGKQLFLSRGYTVRDQQNQYLYSLHVLSDISERRQAQSRLQESEQRYHQIFQNSIDSFWIADTSGHILEANDAYCQLLGYTREELLRMRIEDVEALETPEVMAQHVQEIVTQGHDRFETCHRRKNGELLNIEASVVYMPGMKMGCFFVFMHDITARKQAEQARADGEKRFRALIENAPDGFSLLGADGKLFYASPSTERILGYAPEAVVAIDPNDYTHPDDLGPFLVLLNDLLQKPGGSFTTQYRFKHNDGSWRWLESTVSNLLAEPWVKAIVINYRDITERKQAEADLAEQLEELRSWHEATLGREGRVLELKHEVNQLLAQAGQPPRYPSAESLNPKEA